MQNRDSGLTLTECGERDFPYNRFLICVNIDFRELCYRMLKNEREIELTRGTL